MVFKFWHISCIWCYKLIDSEKNSKGLGLIKVPGQVFCHYYKIKFLHSRHQEQSSYSGVRKPLQIFADFRNASSRHKVQKICVFSPFVHTLILVNITWLAIPFHILHGINLDENGCSTWLKYWMPGFKFCLC